MRQHFSCKDNKTGLSLILSECSYNFAIDFLMQKGTKIIDCKYDRKKGQTVIDTPRRLFFYDENRGVLLGQ
jgi:hypothetical protein